MGTRRSTQILATAGVIYVVGLLIRYRGDPILARFLMALFSSLLFALAIGRLLTIRRKPRLPFRILQTLFAAHGSLLMVQVLMIAGDRTGLVSLDLKVGLLHNRRSFLKLGAEALDRAKRARESVTVLMIDLDHFKLINDRWGHPCTRTFLI